MKNLKVFWVVVLAFVVALLLLSATPLVGFENAHLIWLGLAFCFGSYSGASGLPTILTSRQMPKGQSYTASYPKMLTIVIMSWVLFLAALISVLVAWQLNGNFDGSTAREYLFQGFLFASAIAGIFAGVKKLNSAAKERGPEETSVQKE